MYTKEEMSRNAKWFFGLPLSYVIWMLLSQLVPKTASGPRSILVLNIISYALFIAVLLAVVKYFLKFPIEKFFREQGPFKWKSLFLGFAVMVLTGILTSLVWYLITPENFAFTLDKSGWIFDFLLALIVVVLAATFEELVFRSYIAYFLEDQMTSTTKGRLWYSFAGALVFAAAHFQNPEVAGATAIYSMVFYFMFGFAMMLLTIRTRSIAGALGIHIGNNLVNAWVFTYPDAALETNALFTQSNGIGPMVLVQASVCLIISILVVIQTSRKDSGSLR